MKEYKRETGQEELQKLLNDEVNQILRQICMRLV